LFGLTRHVALDTPLGRAGDATVTDRTKIRWPLSGQASAWDIAYAMVFMLSAKSAYITAQSLVVDGDITRFG
jgi:NAD(P)-dependent dehydrogenase (short-subunit alcohol dehydrogenase family)